MHSPESMALVHMLLHGSHTDHHSFALLKSILNSVTHLRPLLRTSRSMLHCQKESALQCSERLREIVQGILHPVLQRSIRSRSLKRVMHGRSPPLCKQNLLVQSYCLLQMELPAAKDRISPAAEGRWHILLHALFRSADLSSRIESPSFLRLHQVSFAGN